MERYEPQDITNHTQYFYIYFWSRSIISYSTENGSFSCLTNLIKDDYYLNLYSGRYVAYGGYTAPADYKTIINEKINLFRHGKPRPVTPEDTGNTLLVVLLVVVLVFAVAVIICLVVCCLRRTNEPVSMETQRKRDGISTFHSLETTSDVKKPILTNKSAVEGKKKKSKKPF